MKTPKIDDFIRITNRKCGKQQPGIVVGDVLRVKALEKTKSGAAVCVCDDGEKTHRVNADRFAWQVFTAEEAQAYVVKSIEEARTKKMIGGLTPRERLQMAVVPMIYVGLAWEYAAAVAAQAAAERIPELKKACRALRELRGNYARAYRSSLDGADIEILEGETRKFKEAHAYNFQILYWSLNGYFKKVYPVNDHQEMRTNAIIAMLFVRLAYAHSEKWGKIAEQRTGVRQYNKLDSHRNALYVLMKAFAGIDEAFDFGSKEVTDNVKVIVNKMEANELKIKVCV